MPQLVMPSPPAADLGTVREIARMLVAADNPRVQAGRAVRTQAGLQQTGGAGRAAAGARERRRRSRQLPLAPSARRQRRRPTRSDPDARSGGWRCAGRGCGERQAASASARRRCWRPPTTTSSARPCRPTSWPPADPEASLPALIEEVKTPRHARIAARSSSSAASGTPTPTGRRGSSSSTRRATAGTRARSAPRASPPNCGR